MAAEYIHLLKSFNHFFLLNNSLNLKFVSQKNSIIIKNV